MTGIEGAISITLDFSSDRLVSIASSRPLQACKLMEGQSPEDALKRVPLLFALCGKAQELAARQAFQAAGASIPVEPSVQRAMLSEALHEYLWRFLIDLPKLFQQPPALKLFSEFRQQLGELSEQPDGQQLAKLNKLIEEQLLGMDPVEWVCLTISKLNEWISSKQGELAPLLNRIDHFMGRDSGRVNHTHLMQDSQIKTIADTLVDSWRSGAILELQEWQKQPLETGAYSYHQKHPLLEEMAENGFHPVTQRLLARVVDLVKLLDQLAEGNGERSGSVAYAEGEGLGWVKTARGLLMHHVQLQDGQVKQYRIAAPTEWNFHPHGALYQALQQCSEIDRNQLPLWVDLQVLSLDPCVQYEVDINHA